MRSLRRSVFAALFAVTALVGTAVPATAAEDHKAVNLPLTGFTDILVDPGRGHVFVSNRADNAVVVTDLAGTVVGRLDNQPGASGLALSADGGTLFIALSRGGAISAIDTLTLAETARHRVGDGTLCPKELAVSGNKIYFGYACYTGDANFGSATVGSTFDDVRLDLLGPDEYGAPLLATSPGRPDLIATTVTGVSPSTARIFRDTGAGLVEQASDWVGEYVEDIELSTDGAYFHSVGGGSPYDVRVYTTEGLVPQAGYETDAFPNSIAVSRDANVLAGGVDITFGPAVYIFRDGNHTPSRQYDFTRLATDKTQLAPGGLAWGPGGEHLYAVTIDSFTAGATLNILRG